MRQQQLVTILAMLAVTSFFGCNAGSDIISTREGGCNDPVEFESEGLPDISVSTASIKFQYQSVGTVSFPLSVTVMNEGAQSVTIERVLTNCSQFLLELAESLPIVLQSNLVTKFSISFKPEDAVEFDPEAPPSVAAQLLVYFDGVSEPLSVLLTGTGSAEEHILNIDPLAVDFGKIQVDQISARIRILLWNGGTKPETIRNVWTVAPFRVFGFSGVTELQPATSFELEVEFQPNAVGSVEKSLIIETIRSSFQVFVGIPLHGVGTE